MAGPASFVTGRRLRLFLLVTALVVFGASLTANAFWGSTDSSNSAGAAADLLPPGATPTALKTGASTIDLDFARGTTASGREVTSYLVKRYVSAVSGTESASLTCDWPPSTPLDCAEYAVADGTWYYSMTPHIAGSSWLGVESTRSAGVTIDTVAPNPPSAPDLAAPDDSGSSATDNLTNVTTPTFTGTAEAGSTVRTYAGAVQVGSGTATGGAYSIQVSALAVGVHLITATATDIAGNVSGSSEALSLTIDTTAPAVTSTVIAKQTGYLSGAIKQSGSYYIYANVTDGGVGVSMVTADAGSITTGATSVALTAGSYSAEGVVYNYRSSLQAATSSLTSGNALASFSITSTDTAGNAQTQSSFNVNIDNTAPAATDVQTANHASIVGRAETGDTITFTFSEKIDPQSILNGWTGTAATGSVVVRLLDGGCTKILLTLNCADDSLAFYNGTNSAQLPLGTVDLNHSNYNGDCGLLSCTRSNLLYGATGTPSTMVQAGNSITITLGTQSSPGDGNAITAGSSSTMAWALLAGSYDAAGNAVSNSSANESGSGDREF